MADLAQRNPGAAWADVAGLVAAKEALRDAVLAPVASSPSFACRRALLYGAAGVGKTTLAAAAAEAAGAAFHRCHAADLASRWLGGAPRQVQNLFEKAREAKPAIIFIDDLEYFCSSENEHESDTIKAAKLELSNQMLAEGSCNDGVVVLGAANVPRIQDSFVGRLFETHIYLPLPDAAARTRMLRGGLADTPHSITDQELCLLGHATEGLTGADLQCAVRGAQLLPLRALQRAAHFRPEPPPQATASSGAPAAVPTASARPLLTPCHHGEEKAEAMGWEEVEEDRLHLPPLSLEDLRASLASTPASVDTEELLLFRGQRTGV